MIKEFFYLSERKKYRLADEKKAEDDIHNQSKTNCTYRAVSDRFKGEIPTNILSNLNNNIMSSFKNDLSAYRSGERSLANFRRDIAFPFGTRGIQRLSYKEEKNTFCFRLFSVPIKAYLGKDYTDKRSLLEQVVAGQIKLCASKLQLKNQKNYWLAVFEIEKEKTSFVRM